MAQPRQMRSPSEPPGWLRAAAGWSWRLLMVAALIYVVVRSLAYLAIVVLPIILALLLTSLLIPIVRALVRRKVPEGLAAVLVLVGGILLFGAVIALILPSMIDQFGDLGTQLRDGVDEATQVLADPPFNLSKSEIDDRVSKGLDSLRENSGTIGSGVVSGAVVVGELLTGFILTMLLTFFFLKDGSRMWAWVASLAGERRSVAVQEIARRSFTALAGYVRGIAAVGVVDAVLVGIALLILSVPLVIPLMILTFIGAFLPLVGAFMAGLAAVLVALVSNGLIPAAIVLGVYIAVQQLEGHLLYPVLMSRAVNLHPAVILVSLAAGGIIAGVIGIFLAVPVASVIAVTLDYARDAPPPASPLTESGEGPGPAQQEEEEPVTSVRSAEATGREDPAI